MDIILTAVGSAGDIHPFIALAQALNRRGHTTRLLVNPYFEHRVRTAGIDFLPLGDIAEHERVLLHADLVHSGRSPTLVASQLIGPAARPTYTEILKAHHRRHCNLIIHHHISVGARWAAERISVPFATAVLSPLFFFAPSAGGRYRSFMPDRMPPWAARLLLPLGKQRLRQITDPPINDARASIGLPPLRDAFLTHATDAPLVLGLWSPVFRPPAPDDPPNARICGFTWFDGLADAPADVARFLDEGQPPLVFTLGTSVVHHAGELFHHAAEAARRLGRRAMLLVGKPENAPPPSQLPPGVRAFLYAPLTEVMARSCASIHHAGVGTTARALRSGKPSLAIPFANDEFDNAARARRLGAAMEIRPGRHVADRMTIALRALLDSPSHAARAAEVGRVLQGEDGAEAAATAIEARFSIF